MTTVDHLLHQISNHGFENLITKISKRDLRILKNLSVLVNRPEFISENQGKLLVKLLSENLENLDFLGKDIFASLKNPTWSKTFKKVEVIKKLNIDRDENGEKCLKIEFNHSASFKKILLALQKKLEGSVTYNNGRVYLLPLTEKNVVLTVEAFKPQKFEIFHEILELYEVVKKWNGSEIKKDFVFPLIKNTNILSKLSEEVGHLDQANPLILADRKIRFQYEISEKITPTNLTEQLAYRPINKVYVSSQSSSLTSVVESLIELNRFPILVVFNGYNEADSIKDLEKLDTALKDNGITSDVGIYFRFENNANGKIFNQLIADKKFNAHLDEHTKVAGIISGKLPKFFLQSTWQPNAVITFTNNLKHNKTSVYCNSCDLIVYYNEKKPLLESKHGL